MSAYPSYGILLESQLDYEPSWRDDVAESGVLSSRQLRSANYIRFTLLHNLTQAEYNALVTTYNAGPRDTYTLTYLAESPQVTYSVKFIDLPQITANVGGGRFLVSVSLRGTQD